MVIGVVPNVILHNMFCPFPVAFAAAIITLLLDVARVSLDVTDAIHAWLAFLAINMLLLPLAVWNPRSK